MRKLQKREDFSKNSKETQNFIVFVLDKTMRQRHLTKIQTLYDYLVETKINSKKIKIFEIIFFYRK